MIKFSELDEDDIIVWQTEYATGFYRVSSVFQDSGYCIAFNIFNQTNAVYTFTEELIEDSSQIIDISSNYESLGNFRIKYAEYFI